MQNEVTKRVLTEFVVELTKTHRQLKNELEKKQEEHKLQVSNYYFNFFI